MKKLVEFFNSYFKIFPNYVVIECLAKDEREDFGLFKNIERKQRIIDEKLYIAARNKEIKENKRQKKLQKLSNEGFEQFIKVDDDESQDFSYTKMFTTTFYNDISEFKEKFQKEDVDLFWYQNKLKELTQKPGNVFDYQKKENSPRPTILSRNMVDFAAPKNNSPFGRQNKENGWTRLFNFITEES